MKLNTQTSSAIAVRKCLPQKHKQNRLRTSQVTEYTVVCRVSRAGVATMGSVFRNQCPTWAGACIADSALPLYYIGLALYCRSKCVLIRGIDLHSYETRGRESLPFSTA
ncbi:hypothetical protein J6590_043376 [Homalodisca vitripennis]|nr:hypothetical protein J6590_043376 [Homalodisca vitripennis]